MTGQPSSRTEGKPAVRLTGEVVETSASFVSSRQGCESCEVKVLVPPIACSRADSMSDACEGNRRYLCESFLGCLSPYPGGVLSAFAWFFLSLHRLSPSYDWVGFPLVSANTIFHGSAFEAAAISLCSSLQVCWPPRSFLPQQVSLQGSRGSLHPSRTCVVTFTRIGHAIRPTTGNWRNEDFHLARFAALSAAHV